MREYLKQFGHALWLIPICGFGAVALIYGLAYLDHFVPIPPAISLLLILLAFIGAPLFALWFLGSNRDDPLTKRLKREKKDAND